MQGWESALQPQVKNAVFSGSRPGGKSGTIEIYAFSYKKCLFITIVEMKPEYQKRRYLGP
ncbi:hypothetical protein [Lacrimispora brassicae]